MTEPVVSQEEIDELTHANDGDPEQERRQAIVCDWADIWCPFPHANRYCRDNIIHMDFGFADNTHGDSRNLKGIASRDPLPESITFESYLGRLLELKMAGGEGVTIGVKLNSNKREGITADSIIIDDAGSLKKLENLPWPRTVSLSVDVMRAPQAVTIMEDETAKAKEAKTRAKQAEIIKNVPEIILAAAQELGSMPNFSIADRATFLRKMAEKLGLGTVLVRGPGASSQEMGR